MRGYLGFGLIVMASAAAAQVPPQSADERAREQAEQAAYQAKPDTQGTGRYPSLKEMDWSLPDHTIYRPANLSRVGDGELGVIAWGNGGCSRDGASVRFHLSELASHGYLVVAPGRILTGPGAMPSTPRGPGPATPEDYTTVGDVKAGIDWALAENENPGSPYYRKINPDMVAVSGFSCGGIQALKLAHDPRVKAVVIHNSGLLADGLPAMGFMPTSKALLNTLRTPVVYIQGGPSDIAYENGMDDFRRIDHVPAVMLNQDTGHGGTFLSDNGGRAAQVAIAWLGWQLRHDKAARAMFVGEDCGLCRDSAWTIERKNMPSE
ncbi:MAG TPA: hypothetical protein VNR60_07950 [Croceibacterium sp.]|nr:hypothetical protein [Croceibacterium sp.]